MAYIVSSALGNIPRIFLQGSKVNPFDASNASLYTADSIEQDRLQKTLGIKSVKNASLINTK